MAVGGPCSGVNFFTPNSLVQNTDKVKTEGLFGSASFDFTDSLSASLEVATRRTRSRRASWSPAPGRRSSRTRAGCRARSSAGSPPSRPTCTASYSKGILPGVINPRSRRPRRARRPSTTAQFAASPASIKGDELDMYEIGWKQEWLDRAPHQRRRLLRRVGEPEGPYAVHHPRRLRQLRAWRRRRRDGPEWLPEWRGWPARHVRQRPAVHELAQRQRAGHLDALGRRGRGRAAGHRPLGRARAR
jgi:hypothetical protein